MVRGEMVRFLLQSACILALVSCQSAKSNAPEYSTDLQKLERLVTLNPAPSDVFWQVIEKGSRKGQLGPSDWAIVAILQYDESTMKKLQATVREIDPLPDIFLEKDFIQVWFQEPVKNCFVQDSNSDYYIITVPAYPPELFAKSPLLHGYFFIVPRENLVFLYLHTA